MRQRLSAAQSRISEIDRVTNTYHADGNYTQSAAKVLKSVDYDNLDVIVIMYDASDYFEARAIENPKDDEERCKSMSASYLQGYKYSRPIPIIELKKFFSKIGE